MIKPRLINAWETGAYIIITDANRAGKSARTSQRVNKNCKYDECAYGAVYWDDGRMKYDTARIGLFS